MTTKFGRIALRLSAGLAVALSLQACEGKIGGSAALAPGSVAANAGAAGASGSTTCAEAASAVGPMFLRRLTNREYASTVRELLGAEVVVSSLPPDITLFGFDNNAESFSLSTAHLEGFRALAEGAAADLVASESRRASLVGCDPAGADSRACLEAFVRSFGLRAFRRPLTEAEVADLLALAATVPVAAGAWAGVSIVIEGLLQAPSFLFRVEQGQPEPGRSGVARLTGYEMATRLAYLLWGTTPDAELFRAAQAGALESADGVSSRALAMLDDEAKALPTVWSFAGQWLRAGNLAGVTRSNTDFPAWNEALRAAMTEETRRVVERHVSQRKPLLDLLDSQSTFVDATLASLYGVAPPPAGAWIETTLPVEQARRGILTHAGILTLTSNTHGTTPILRGKYLRQVLLCDELPPPPPSVPALPEAVAGAGERERLTSHRTDPACAACHSMLEPLGFGLSRFDALGAYRATDAGGLAIDAHGEIDGLDDASFDGAAQLADRLRREPKVGRCIATHLLRFALGRKETPSESCSIEQLGDVLQRGGDFRALVSALVQTDAFRFRPAADAAQGARP